MKKLCSKEEIPNRIQKMNFAWLKVGIDDYTLPIAIPQNPTYNGDILKFVSGISSGKSENSATEITWIRHITYLSLWRTVSN